MIRAFCDRQRAFLGLAAVLVLVWVEVAVADRTTGGDYLFVALLTFGPWLVGRIVAARSELAAELSDKADRLEREQDKQAQHFHPLVVIVGLPASSFEIGHPLRLQCKCPVHVVSVSLFIH